VKLELTKLEVEHLKNLMEINCRTGVFFGTKKRYWNRHHYILMKFEDALFENTTKHIEKRKKIA